MDQAHATGPRVTQDEGVGPVAVVVVEALAAAGIPCAVGGALALGVWGVPRGTTDVDLDAFVSDERYDDLLDALEAGGCSFDREEALRQAREGDTIVVRHGPFDATCGTLPPSRSR